MKSYIDLVKDSFLDERSDRMWAAIEKILQWTDNYMDFGERPCPFCGHHYNHDDKCLFIEIRSLNNTA